MPRRPLSCRAGRCFFTGLQRSTPTPRQPCGPFPLFDYANANRPSPCSPPSCCPCWRRCWPAAGTPAPPRPTRQRRHRTTQQRPPTSPLRPRSPAVGLPTAGPDHRAVCGDSEAWASDSDGNMLTSLDAAKEQHNVRLVSIYVPKLRQAFWQRTPPPAWRGLKNSGATSLVGYPGQPRQSLLPSVSLGRC